MKSIVFEIKTYSAMILVGAAVCLVSTFAFTAVPSDPQGVGKVTAVNVVCDDAGTTNATLMPTAALEQRNAVEIQNNGPAAIYCGFTSAVTASSGRGVASSGGTWSVDIKYLGGGTAQKIYCKQDLCSATIVNQVADGGLSNTRVTEVR